IRLTGASIPLVPWRVSVPSGVSVRASSATCRFSPRITQRRPDRAPALHHGSVTRKVTVGQRDSRDMRRRRGSLITFRYIRPVIHSSHTARRVPGPADGPARRAPPAPAGRARLAQLAAPAWPSVGRSIRQAEDLPRGLADLGDGLLRRLSPDLGDGPGGVAHQAGLVTGPTEGLGRHVGGV